VTEACSLENNALKSHTNYANCHNIAQNSVHLWHISSLITAENYAQNCCVVFNILQFSQWGLFIVAHCTPLECLIRMRLQWVTSFLT